MDYCQETRAGTELRDAGGESEADNPRPKARPAGHRMTLWTIGRKLVFAVAGCVAIGFMTMVAMFGVSERSDLIEQATSQNVTITSLLAGAASGAVRWRKSERIAVLYDQFRSEGYPVASFAAYDSDGNLLSRYRAANLPPYKLDGVVDLAAKPLAAGRPVSRIDGRHQIVVMPVTAGKNGDRVGTLAVAWSLSGLYRDIIAAIGLQIGLALAILGAVATVLYLLLRRIVTGPLRDLTAVMNRLAEGDKSVEPPALDRGDEIGDMARAVAVFREEGRKLDEMRAREKAAEKARHAERRNLLLQIADDFESKVKHVVDTVSSASTEMQATAETMSTSAERTSRQTTAVAAASEQASGNVQTVAAAAEEMAKSIDEIGRQVSRSTDIAKNAVGEAARTNTTVQGLAEAAQRIGEVVHLISDITERTNLLALNATIEASRAGDAGKGFAVVAEEVKELANQTARATDEIARQIRGIQSVSGEAVDAIRGIGETIKEIDEIATTIASAVEEQGAATQEIARNVQQAARGTSEVSENVAAVSGTVGETGAAAGQVLDAAKQLSSEAERLRSEVGRFLDEVRAA